MLSTKKINPTIHTEWKLLSFNAPAPTLNKRFSYYGSAMLLAIMGIFVAKL
jgi:hypothetical protein